MALTAPASNAAPPGAQAPHPGPWFPEVIELPPGVQPEGIAIGRGARAWTGSLSDGDLYEIDLRTGRLEVLSEGPGTPSVGMKLDPRGRLWVAGGTAGDARVVGTRSGEVVASYQLGQAGAFVNDVVLTKRAAWFTDSAAAVLYHVPFGRGGRPAEPSQVTAVPLGGEWVQGAGFGANGISTTPDGRALLVVNSTTGVLYRVDPRTGEAAGVDLGGVSVADGDGMLRDGRTLYVVLNRQNRIAVVRLDHSGAAGEVTGYLTSEAFDVPTTVARLGRWLYLPNARFTTPPTPETIYTVVRVPGA